MIHVQGGVISNSMDGNYVVVGQALRAWSEPTICKIKNMKVVISVYRDDTDQVGSITLTLRHKIVASRARQD